jgi:hypothetical protein
MYFTSTSDTFLGAGVLVVDVAGDVVSEGVLAVVVTDEDADALVAGIMTATRRSGIEAGTGCADCIVVLSAGAKASSSIAPRSNGQIPVLRKALRIVPAVKALARAHE